jgi:hypothetical protein
MLKELLDEPEEMGIADRLGGLDLIHLAVEGAQRMPLALSIVRSSDILGRGRQIAPVSGIGHLVAIL